MSHFAPELTVRLADLLAARTCIVGVGNRQRGDDGAGPRLIDSLAARLGDGVRLIDAGTAPENHLEPIAKAAPDAVLLVDAVAFGGSPGNVRLLDSQQLAGDGLSTHCGSLELVCDYLSARTQAAICLLGIQPQSVEFQHGLSPPVEAAVQRLTALLGNLLGAACVRMSNDDRSAPS